MSADLAEWLAARYDEAEALAYGLCGNGPLAKWTIRDGDIFVGTEPLPGEPIAQTWDNRVARFIAASDPAHRLADIRLKRAILALHRSDSDVRPHWCTECSCSGALAATDCIGSVDWPCATVRQLGTEFAGRDGYREEWAP